MSSLHRKIMDNTYYIKKGRKYIPVGGHSLPFDNIADGIWVVQSKPDSRSYTSILYRMHHDFNKFYDLNFYAEQVEMTEVLVGVIREMVDKEEFVIYNHSIYDVADKMSKAMYAKIKKLKTEKKEK